MTFVATPKTDFGFSDRCRALINKLRDRLPYIKRKRHEKIVAAMLGDARLSADRLLALPSKAVDASITPCIPLRTAGVTELCLFLTFAARPTLKTHVTDHVNALIAEGIAVVLIVNTPCSAKEFVFESEFAARLSGCFVRENVGFDFAAWAQVYSLVEIPPVCRRLYLVNDSIIGPLRSDSFKKMIANIRDSACDLLSLTGNTAPLPHLQSYFLVIGGSLLRSNTFTCFMQGILNLPTKEAVISHYETQLTRFLSAHGFRCQALFPKFATDGVRTDDTVFNWARLIDAGFPFIKAKVLEVSRSTPEARQRIPDRYLGS